MIALLLLVVVVVVVVCGVWGGDGEGWVGNSKRGRGGEKKGTRSSHSPSCMGFCTASGGRVAATLKLCFPRVAFCSDCGGSSISVASPRWRRASERSAPQEATSCELRGGRRIGSA